MGLNNNRWNKVRYSFYAPIYHFAIKVLERPRSHAHSILQVKPDERVLICGCGTGSDLEFIPVTCDVEATDLTPVMVRKTQELASKLGMKVKTKTMDAGKLDYPDDHFDVVILHLIVAVIPDPDSCLSEARRVLKPGGRISIFDKFLKEGQQPSLFRKASGLVTELLFSNINRQIEPLLKNHMLKVESDVAVFAGNFFRALIVKHEDENAG